MLELNQQINLGQDYDQVIKKVEDFQQAHPKYHINTDKNLQSKIEIMPPSDYTFTWFWIMIVKFDKNNHQVSGIYFRPMDGDNYRFCDAPADKGIAPKTKAKCIS